MSKIREIRKIESPIKEIKKEKVESLDDEVDDDFEDQSFSANSFGVKRFNKTSTLDASEIPKDSAVRERTISKEDEKEIRFRPSYTAGTENRGSAYTPAGSAESGGMGQARQLGERSLGQDRQLQQNSNSNDGQQGAERAYVNDNIRETDEKKEDHRRRNLM